MKNSPSSQDNEKELAQREIARRILAKRLFLPFIKYVSPWFKVNFHHEIIADALQRVESGELKRLMIFLPPRHGKSEMVSIAFPPWFFGRNPNKSIIEASYSADLATEFGRQARNIVDSREYQNIFDTRLAEDSQSKSTWSTNGRGKYNAVGVGGAVTGKGADVLIIDDPVKNRKEADSFLIRENIYKWYRSTALTRLSPTGAVIMVVTRWSDDDLPARALDSETGENWEVISLPAIAVENEEYRKKGDALWPQQFDLANLLNTKAEVGNYEWASLYQQSPINSETQEFTDKMFKSVALDKVNALRTLGYATIDPAVKEKDTADYTGTIINRVDEDNNWYIKANRKRINSTKLIDHIFDIWENEDVVSIGVEETTYYDAVYPFLKLEMIKRNIFPVVYGLKHGGVNKHLRIRALLPRYESGKIFHIEGECEFLEEEMLRFPKGKNDDEVDALAYQEQIVVAPEPETTFLQQVRSNMEVDDRTGYLR
jgi:hypothetical protein